MTAAMSRQTVTEAMFKQYDHDNAGELTPVQLMNLHGSLRQGGISIPQVSASVSMLCMQ